ncbi:D-alanyl-D-alanine carboxypeptidase [Streptomyces aureocirculatus]|nr:D-alanyl-D-alanine carboxypeptidase [Streptomyces aureocirculatus]
MGDRAGGAEREGSSTAVGADAGASDASDASADAADASGGDSDRAADASAEGVTGGDGSGVGVTGGGDSGVGVSGGGDSGAGGGGGDAASGSAVDMATAVFTAARPAAKADTPDAGGESGTAAGAVDDADSADAKADAEDGAKAEGGESQPQDPRADRATAVFNTGRKGGNGASGGPKTPSWAAAAKPEAEAEAEPTKPDADAESKAGPAKPDAEPKADADSKAEAGSKADADSEPDADSKAEADAKPDADFKAKPKSGSAKPKPDPAKPGSAKPRSEDGRPLDQATAVFKAPRPASSGVDQPTTTLKLGDVPEPDKRADAEKKPEGKKKPGGKPETESESERTSKFVALKPLEDSRTRTLTKPGAKPDAGATALPAQPGSARTGPARTGSPQAPPPEAASPEATRQQPLPPKPPIDLLAELTNTPPPPETRVRTLVRRFKIWTPLVLLLVVVFAVAQAVRPLPEAKLTLTSASSYAFKGGKPSIPWPGKGQAAMDVDGIGSFGTAGEQKPVPIASIAKVMTTYLILRDHPIKKGGNGKTLTVDAQAQRHYEKGKPENESVVKVTEGQKITQYEALQAVMLPSANNVARMLARWDSNGSEDKFVAKMNETAKELGMKNTHYTDPSGLNKTTVSTAEDLVKLGRVAMENPVFKEIAGQRNYKDLNGDRQTNYFGLVPTVAIGIKTGTTTAAGGNILFAAEKRVGGRTHVIIGAALAQFGSGGVANIDKVTGVTKDLIAAGQDALKARTVVKKGQVVGEVDDGLGGTTPVVATRDVTAVGWSGLTSKVEIDDAGKTPPHSAKAGTVVGRLTVGDGTTTGAIKVPVALQKDLSEPGFGAKLTRIG